MAWLTVLGISLIFSDQKLSVGRAVFYPPEIVIYIWGVSLLLKERGSDSFWQTLKELPRGWKVALTLIFTGALLGAFVSPIFPQSLGALKSWFIAPLILALILLKEKVSSRDLLPLVVVLTVGLVISGLATFNWQDLHERLRGFYQSPNYFAQIAVPILAFLYVCYRMGKFRPAVFFPIAAPLLVALLLGQSVGGLLGLAVAIAGFELTRRVKRVQLLSGVVMLIVLAVIGSISYQRLSKESNSLDSRAQIWRSAVLMIERQPVTGPGLRGFEVRYPVVSAELFGQPIDPSAAQPHDLLLSFWVNIGILGLLGMAILFYWAFRQRRFDSPAWWALIAVFVIGILDTPYWRPDLAVMFWMYFALLESERKDESALV